MVNTTTSTLALSLAEGGNYTFSIFGRNKTHIDERPITTEFIETAMGDSACKLAIGFTSTSIHLLIWIVLT